MIVDVEDMRWEARFGKGCNRHAMMMLSAACEIDTLRAQNAALISAAQKQDQREHEFMMERRELAKQVRKHTRNNLGERSYCAGCGAMEHMIDDWRVRLTHSDGCPVALAERVLAEPVAKPRAISGGNAPDLAQGGAE